MFNDFKPTPRLPHVIRDDIAKKQAHVDALHSEMVHHALIGMDRRLDGMNTEITDADYLAARERWEAAVVELDVERAAAIAENSLALIHAITETPRHLEVVK